MNSFPDGNVRCAIAESNRHIFRLHVMHSCNRYGLSQLPCQNAKLLFLKEFRQRRRVKPGKFYSSGAIYMSTCRHLPVQWIFNRRGSCPHEAPELGLEFCHFFLHFPGDAAIAEMTLHAGAEAGYIFRFREIHLE